MPARTILIVDDEPAARYALRRALEHAYRIAEAESAPAAREALVRERPDLVLLDIVMNDEDGLSFLRWMREAGHAQPVIVVSALDTARTALDALKLGATDYLVKGFDVEELRKRVGNLLRLHRARTGKRAPARAPGDGRTIRGDARGHAGNAANYLRWPRASRKPDATVLILGESGTGKDLLAQEIHARSVARGEAIRCRELCGAS